MRAERIGLFDLGRVLPTLYSRCRELVLTRVREFDAYGGLGRLYYWCYPLPYTAAISTGTAVW